MKKVFRILFLLVFAFIIVSISKNVEANSISKISMDIYVDGNGNAQITEVWNCYVNQGTEVYHPYYNLGTSEITNLQVSEVGKVYTSLVSWNTSGSLSSKAYKCGINDISNGVELCWGISEYGNHTYTVKYNISNFVSSLSDSQIMYWTLIPYDFSNSIGNVYIKIHTNFNISDTTDVWGYGNYGGTAYVYNGYIEMQSAGTLDSDEYMTILVKFPLGTFNTRNTINNDFEYYYNMAQEGSTSYNSSPSSYSSGKLDFVLPLITCVFGFFFPFLVSIIAIGSTPYDFNFGSEGKKFSKDTPYFRDIPCNKDLLRSYYIAYQYGIIKKKTDLLGAIILKWLKDGIITIDKTEIGLILKRESSNIILNRANISKIDNFFEEELFRMLLSASKDDILESKEFEKYCKSNYDKVLKWFDDIIKDEKQKLVNEGLITVEEKKKLGMFKHKMYTATSSLRRHAEEIYGLKRYLLDYTLIKDREVIEVQLFEEYLIYAQMLGIAKKVAKDFKELYPDIIEQSSFDTYDTIIFINTWSTHSASAAASAQARAESYSSGGGGFSSGGGGGGSFGGGGGRRRLSLKNVSVAALV